MARSRQRSLPTRMDRWCASRGGVRCSSNLPRSWHASARSNDRRQPRVSCAERCDSPANDRAAERWAGVRLGVGQAAGGIPGGSGPTSAGAGRVLPGPQPEGWQNPPVPDGTGGSARGGKLDHRTPHFLGAQIRPPRAPAGRRGPHQPLTPPWTPTIGACRTVRRHQWLTPARTAGVTRC